VLTSHIITRLLSDDQDGKHERDRDRDDATTTTTTTTTTAVAEATATERASHDVCLAAWAAWLIERRRGNSNGDESDADIAARRQDIFFQLVQVLAAATPQPQRETFSSSLSSSSSSSDSHHHAGCVIYKKKIVATGRKKNLTTDDLTSFTTHNTNLPLTTPKKKTNFVDPAVIRGISVFVRGGTGREPYSRRSALRTGGSQTFQIPSWPRPRPRPRYG